MSKDRLYTFGASRPGDRRRPPYIIVEGLTRLMAPVLPVTAEELWRHLPGARESSVHLALFPRDEDLARFVDDSLAERWAHLIDAREVVNREIELQRKAKTVGTSLEASLRLWAEGDIVACLRHHESDLPMLFIVSEVALEPGPVPPGTDAVTVPGGRIAVRVSRASGTKCERCWRYVRVSTDPGHPGVCDRDRRVGPGRRFE